MTALSRLLCKVYCAASLMFVGTLVVCASIAVVAYAIANENFLLMWRALTIGTVVAAITFLISVTITVLALKASVSAKQRRRLIIRGRATDERTVVDDVAILPWLEGCKKWYVRIWVSITVIYFALLVFWTFHSTVDPRFVFAAIIFAIPIYFATSSSYLCVLFVTKSVETVAGKTKTGKTITRRELLERQIRYMSRTPYWSDITMTETVM